MSFAFSGAYSNALVNGVDADSKGWTADLGGSSFDSTTTADVGWEDTTWATNNVTGSVDILWNPAKHPTGSSLTLMAGTVIQVLTLYINKPDGESLNGTALILKREREIRDERRRAGHGVIHLQGQMERPLSMNNLTALTDGPQLSVPIGRVEYRFSELPITHLKQLQTWLERAYPHPIEAIKKHLPGLPDEVQFKLLEKAREEARNWPPQISTFSGVSALVSGEAGQLEAFRVGLTVHQPQTTEQEARKLFRNLEREARKTGNERVVARIYACLFGMPDPHYEDESAPK